MKLSDLARYRHIVIQCHDNPDPDAVASGYALYRYFTSDPGRSVRLVYSGKYRISKSNILMMIDRLDIPLEYVSGLPEPAELLVVVDGQYGEGNVSTLPAMRVAVIDHHPDSGRAFDYKKIRSAYGSCATLVYQLLKEAGVDINADIGLATALYYGLYTDTNSLSEISHPADKDLRDELSYNKSLVHALRNANLSAEEIVVAGDALKHAVFDDDHRFAVAEAGPCDPNILGFISDMLLQVNRCDSCVVFCRLPFGIKFSVRSCTPEIHAGEMAKSLAESIGSGGGHNEKAGGFINESALSEFFSSEKKRGDADSAPTETSSPSTENSSPSAEASSRDADFFRDRMIHYLQSFDILYSTAFEPDHAAMATFIKLQVPLGYVRSLDVLAEGDSATVRTLEGDINIRASEDIYIMIGISGEVYPIKRSVFEKRYVATTDPYKASFEYAPTVKRTDTQQSVPLMDFAFVCVPSEETRIFARPLDRTVKVFTAWDPDHYMLGKPGDYLAAHCENPKDVYVIARDIFEKTYRPADTDLA